jgi:hypothetical protein
MIFDLTGPEVLPNVLLARTGGTDADKVAGLAGRPDLHSKIHRCAKHRWGCDRVGLTASRERA